MEQRTSRLYSIQPKDLPLKSEKSGRDYGERFGFKGWSVRGNIQRAQKLYELYNKDRAQYEQEVAQQGNRLRTLGIIADIAGETDLAIDLLRRTEDNYYSRYLEWREVKRTPTELAASLEDGELDKVIGIFVRKKDFETANFLRGELRQRYRREAEGLLAELKAEGVEDESEIRFETAQRLYQLSAELSRRVGDWQGFAEDFERTPTLFGSKGYDSFDLITYARMSRKQSREVSDKLYDFVEQEASAGRKNPKSWAWIGLARAGKGDKKGAVQAYERAGCFTQARNLRKNLGLSTKPAERRILEKDFYMSFLDSDYASRGVDYEENDEPQSREDFSFFSLYHQQIEGLSKMAKKFGLENLLVSLMKDTGMYSNLGYAYEQLGLEKEDVIPLTTLIRDVEGKINGLAREGEFSSNPQTRALRLVEPFNSLFRDQSARELASGMIDLGHIRHRQLLSLIGFSGDNLDYLSLGWVNRVPCQEEDWNKLCHIWGEENVFLGQDGLETATSLFNNQRYLLLLGAFPKLLEESSPDRIKNFEEVFKEEIARQKQIKGLIRLSSKRLRRQLSGLGMDIWNTSFGGNYVLEERLEIP